MPTTSQPPQPQNGLQLNTDNTFDVLAADSTISVSGSGVKTSNVASTGDHYVVGQGGEGDTDIANRVVIPYLTVHPDIRVAGTNDDEFDATLSGWTTLGSLNTSVSNSDLKSHYHIARTTGGLAVDGIYKACPSIPFTMTAKLSAHVMTTNYQSIGILIAEATPGKINGFSLIHDSTQTMGAYLGHSAWTDRTHFGSVTNDRSVVRGMLPIYLRIVVHSSTNVDYAFSYDGLLYTTVASGNNPSFTVGAVGLWVTSFSGSASEEGYFDWIRFT